MDSNLQFTGFTRDTSDYLWDLAFHNKRPWFQEHKDRFLRVLKDPFDALARETLDLMQARFPDRPFQMHVSRIYRDARRLFGRGPYKDHLWFTVWSGADKHDNPAFWFELSASGYEYGMGFFEARPEEMEATAGISGRTPPRWKSWRGGCSGIRSFTSSARSTSAPRGTWASC